MKKIEFEIAIKLMGGEKIGTYSVTEENCTDLFILRDYCTYYDEHEIAILVGKVPSRKNLMIFQDFKNRNVPLLTDESKWDISKVQIGDVTSFDSNKFIDGYNIGYTRIYGIEDIKDFLRTLITLENFYREEHNLPLIDVSKIHTYFEKSKSSIREDAISKIINLKKSSKINRIKRSNMSSCDLLIHFSLRQFDYTVCPFQFSISSLEEERETLKRLEVFIDEDEDGIEMTIIDDEFHGRIMYKCKNGTILYDAIREIEDGEFIRIRHKITDRVNGDLSTGEVLEVIRGLKNMLTVSKDSDLVYNIGENKTYSYGEWNTASEEDKEYIFEEIRNAISLTSVMTIDRLPLYKKTFRIK